jgi:DNA-binding PadR family transcriptional regulator
MRRNQTETAVLGALSIQPMTGYALREAIRDVLGHFWSESYGQIYPTLRALVQQGLLTQIPSSSDGRTSFTITESGLLRLRELLAKSIQDPPPRNGLMLRLYFGRHLGPDACRALITQTKAQAEGQLAGYQAIRSEILDTAGSNQDSPYWLLTLSAGEHTARALIAWADEALTRLADLTSTESATSPASLETPPN